jgi:hypothetical protein
MTSTPKRGSSKERLRVRLHPEEVESPPEGGERPDPADVATSPASPSNSQTGVSHAEHPLPAAPFDHDFLDVVTRLVEIVERGRASLLEAEEARRNAELRAAGFQGEIMLEREIRRRTEAELQELKAMIEGRRQPANERIDRVASEDPDSGHEPETEMMHNQVDSSATPPAFDPRGRALTVLGVDNANGPLDSSATTVPSFDPDGRPVIAPDGEQADDAGTHPHEADGVSARGNEAPETTHSVAAADSTLRHLDADGEAAAEAEPPLPPGWRYATDSPPPKKRWWAKKV